MGKRRSEEEGSHGLGQEKTKMKTGPWGSHGLEFNLGRPYPPHGLANFFQIFCGNFRESVEKKNLQDRVVLTVWKKKKFRDRGSLCFLKKKK